MQSLRALSAAVVLLVSACNNPGGGGAAGGDGKALFKTRCASCHGEDGKGTGPAAAALNPKPRDFSDAAWQKGVTDDAIKKTIVGGGQSVGKSPGMPPAPDLEGKPELDALVKTVRSF